MKNVMYTYIYIYNSKTNHLLPYGIRTKLSIFIKSIRIIYNNNNNNNSHIFVTKFDQNVWTNTDTNIWTIKQTKIKINNW